MTKAAVKKDEKTEEVNLPSKVSTDEGSVLTTAEVLKALYEGEVDTEKDLVNEYHIFEEGVEERVIYLGLTQMKDQNGQMKDAVRLLTKSRGEVLNADVVLVSTLRREKAPFAVQLTCTGWSKSAKGKYREFIVNPVNVKF